MKKDNFYEISGSIYLVTTQAGFNQVVKILS